MGRGCENEQQNMEKLRLASILKELINNRDITLRELSKQTKVPQPTLSSYLAGAGSSKPQHIRALAKFFGVSMEFLLFGEDDRPPTLEEVLTEHVFDGWLRVKVERAIPNRRKIT